MKRIEYLLAKVSEESHEVGQRAIKSLVFGTREIQPSQPLDNMERLLVEFNDLLAVMEMLQDCGAFKTNIIDAKMIRQKKSKLEKYMKYSQKLGILD
jgi:hypothetical protein